MQEGKGAEGWARSGEGDGTGERVESGVVQGCRDVLLRGPCFMSVTHFTVITTTTTTTDYRLLGPSPQAAGGRVADVGHVQTARTAGRCAWVGGCGWVGGVECGWVGGWVGGCVSVWSRACVCICVSVQGGWCVWAACGCRRGNSRVCVRGRWARRGWAGGVGGWAGRDASPRTARHLPWLGSCYECHGSTRLLTPSLSVIRLPQMPTPCLPLPRSPPPPFHHGRPFNSLTIPLLASCSRCFLPCTPPPPPG